MDTNVISGTADIIDKKQPDKLSDKYLAPEFHLGENCFCVWKNAPAKLADSSDISRSLGRSTTVMLQTKGKTCLFFWKRGVWGRGEIEKCHWDQWDRRFAEGHVLCDKTLSWELLCLQ